MAQITFVEVLIDETRAVEVATVVSDALGWNAELGISRADLIHDHVLEELKTLYNVTKRRENNAGYNPPDTGLNGE